MSSFVFVSGFDDPVCESGSVGVLGVGGVDDTEKPSRDNEVDGTRALARLLQDTAHGGEWLDSFEDDSKIDWTMSDHIYMNNNDIIMDIRPAVDPNTVALWHFDESSGNTANDVTSNNHDGTISGATWVPGLFGSALSFDGTNDYVLVSDHDDFSIDTTGKLSIEFWMRTGNDVTSRQDVFGKGGQSPSGPWEWTIMVMNGKLIGTYVQASNGGSLRIEDVSISTNTWYHVIIVFRGYTQNDNIDIYLNGVEKSVLQFHTGNTYSNTAGDFGIGRGYGSSAWRYFNGTLDEIRISNCIRSPISYYANLTSNQINLPENMRWDTFIINKTEPQKNFINITILNASNDHLVIVSFSMKINLISYSSIFHTYAHQNFSIDALLC